MADVRVQLSRGSWWLKIHKRNYVSDKNIFSWVFLTWQSKLVSWSNLLWGPNQTLLGGPTTGKHPFSIITITIIGNILLQQPLIDLKDSLLKKERKNCICIGSMSINGCPGGFGDPLRDLIVECSSSGWAYRKVKWSSVSSQGGPTFSRAKFYPHYVSIKLVHLPPPAINDPRSLIHRSDLINIAWPQSAPNSRSKVVTQHLYRFRKVVLTQKVFCAQFLLIIVNLGEVLHSLPPAESLCCCWLVVSPVFKVNAGDPQAH